MNRKRHHPDDSHYPSGRSRAESAPVHDTRRGISPTLSHRSDNSCHAAIVSPVPSNTLNPVSAAISALAAHAHTNAATCPSRNCVSPAVTTPFCQLSGLLARTPTPPSTPQSPRRAFSRNSDVSVQSLINARNGLISPSSVLGAPPYAHSVGPSPPPATSSSQNDFMGDETTHDIGCGSISPVSSDSTVSYGSSPDVTIAAVVIFHNLRSLRKSPRGFLREEMDLSVQNGHELRSIKILREPEHHEFVNVFEFNIEDCDEVTSIVTSIAKGEYTRCTINLNAALTKRGSSSQKKRARTQTPISQNETVFRLNNAARGVGTPYRLEVTVSDGVMDIIHKSEIFRVFGPTSEFGRTTQQDKMNCLSNEQGLGMIRKVSRETIEEMMPEIITTVRVHLMQHKEAQRIQRNRQLEMLLRENSRLHQMMSSQLKVQIP